MAQEFSSEVSPSETTEKTSDMSDIEKLQLATCFLTDLLKNYKLYKENSGIFSPIYSICDHCYSIRPKWSKGRVDYYNFVHDIMFCSDCFSSLDDETRKCFEVVTYEREEKGGLYVSKKESRN